VSVGSLLIDFVHLVLEVLYQVGGNIKCVVLFAELLYCHIRT